MSQNKKEWIFRVVAAVCGIMIALISYSFYFGYWKSGIEKDIKKMQEDVCELKNMIKIDKRDNLSERDRLIRIDEKVSNIENDITEIKKSIRVYLSYFPPSTSALSSASSSACGLIKKD